MTLTADIGNSHSVIGIWRDGNLIDTLRLATESRRTADEWLLFLRSWISGNNVLGTIRSAAVASVVPAANSAVSDAITALGVSRCTWLSADLKLNFSFNYPQKQTLGADRIADMLAAVHYFGPNCVVLDFGTAITFSVVTDGAFQGGVIAPGITSSLEALFSSTAKLPKIAFHRTSNAIGKSTAEAIEIGAYVGWRGVVKEILTDIKSELPDQGRKHRVIATGGISESLDFAPDFFDIVDRNLTMKGIYLASLAQNI
ncbi:type III pantothenate kinase [Turneriella parva]|uniref:Type III pantothenate kinase n=1 Tax=Turneriella parva (strain ATCC BAA-1111 / DSM 21527 / NCTC 11395 / H) TaxID=869212 RepID=I4B4P7_TURPD|nr:type III pantothenate kinase [Turneriella parva]AFM12254.1 pantothenate kinase [Turneriella parva DSM 21527]